MPDRAAAIEIYGDESLRRGPFDVVGALWVESNAAGELRRELERLRAMHGWLNPRGEWKWVKTAGSRPHPAYLDLIRLAAHAAAEDRIAFRALAVPVRLKRWVHTGTTARLDHYTTWLMLLRRYTLPGCRHLVRLDSRTDLHGESLGALCDALNVDSRTAFGENCYAAVEARESRADDLIQLADVLTGAVGWHLSRQHLKVGASASKSAVAGELCRALGLADLASCREAKPYPAWEVLEWRPE